MESSKDHKQIDEWARMTLPIMTKQHISVTPENYAVWYSYITGENKKLKLEIDGLLRAKTPITQEMNQAFFIKHISTCDIARFNEVRNEMSDILMAIGSSIDAAGSSSEKYSEELDSFANTVDNETEINNLKEMLVTIIAETRYMQESTQTLKKGFDDKNNQINALQEELEREKIKSTTDPLTNLANRCAFMDAINSLDTTADKTNCLIMIDIDHFKNVNDTYGHVMGDRVIKFIAKIIKDTIKGQDTAARYGGEEFAVLLPNTNLQGAQAVAETIRAIIASAKMVKSSTKESIGQITISLGIALHQENEVETDFINRADQALYHSKHAGRNRVSTEKDL